MGKSKDLFNELKEFMSQDLVSDIKPKEKRVRLDDDDFKTLVEGGIVEQNGVKIILADIGYERMMEHIINATKS